MSSTDDFAAECKAAARNLRRVPKDLRRTLSHEVQDQVARPLSGKINAAASGPWARVLSVSARTRAAAEPTIVVGGSRPRLSGGAGPRQVIFGTEFGGGKRLTAVPRKNGHRGYRRYSTNQFAAHQRPFVFPTIGRELPNVLDTFADITMGVLEKAVND